MCSVPAASVARFLCEKVHEEDQKLGIQSAIIRLGKICENLRFMYYDFMMFVLL